jgi:hypothetical protein
VQATALNCRIFGMLEVQANADGDPAADGMEILLTVGRCNVERDVA